MPRSTTAGSGAKKSSRVKAQGKKPKPRKAVSASGRGAPRGRARAKHLIQWPTASARLDTATANMADLLPTRFDAMLGLPLIRSFGLADNAQWATGPQATPPVRIHYNWDYSCKGSHEAFLETPEFNFINLYDSGFVYDPTQPLPQNIAAPAHYQAFLQFLATRSPNTPVGSYISGTVCIDQANKAYAENWYPASTIDCYDVDPGGPGAFGTAPRDDQWCPAQPPALWWVNMASVMAAGKKTLTPIAKAFIGQVRKTLAATNPRPRFVFVDNIQYVLDDVFRTGNRAVDCRLEASVNAMECIAYRPNLEKYGAGASLEDLIAFYGELIKGIVAEGVRPVLNIGVVSWVLGQPSELPYVAPLEAALGDNGVSFEMGFDRNGRTTCAYIQGEIALFHRWLKQGKLIWVSSSDQGTQGQASRWSQSYWIAAMAMLVKRRNDSMFVARTPDAVPPWAAWPSQYGDPLADAVFTPRVRPPFDPRGDLWRFDRDFAQGHITASHAGVGLGASLQLTDRPGTPGLLPELQTNGPYVLIDGPRDGTWIPGTFTYQAPGVLDVVDYMTFAQQTVSGWSKNLITISLKTPQHS
jgi:hypothetical protein